MEEDKKAPKEESPKRGKYDEKLKVKGSFLDIVKATVKDANTKKEMDKKEKE
ncbi:MAG TPA: hypothetical protein PKY06_13335 [Saprospiraceae bacterium]|nr:hypothetical protein [Saprospiraceae bacterium]